MADHVFLPTFTLRGRRWRVRLRWLGGLRFWRVKDTYAFPNDRFVAHRVRVGPVLVVALVD